MKITILGNNSAIPAHGRNPSAQIVEIKDHLLLLDCGEGTQMQLMKYGIKRSKIQHIFISHLHGDHYFGLIGLINSLGLLGRTDPLHIHCPEKLPKIIKLQLDACGSIMPFDLIFQTIKDEGENRLIVENGLYSVSCFPVDHRIPTHGFVITEKSSGRKIVPEACREYNIPQAFYNKLKLGEDYTRKDGLLVKNEWVTEVGKADKVYAYCADTKYTLSFLQVIKNADAIYHESTYLDAESDLANMRYHTTARQAAMLAEEAEVKMLLLGHYSSRYKNIEEFEVEAKAIFTNTRATYEGLSVEL
ncbi:ribonuclease Z [Taibaiella sp. KBW10]|uniref:ribonuclease Z n=1 Tax=Taibaiella sp. KBW10 TaxID=2153357 RepID=UPI001F1B0C9D|nr:ribonuclease Z [Taibaiella sp. KBW10]